MILSPKHASFAAAQPKHVLIVDDDASILTVLSRSLKHQGYQVTTVSDDASASALLAKEWIDLIVTDVTMPGGDGLSALKRWRHLGYTMPVIVMSAHHLLLNAAKAAELGAIEFLAKPFDLDQLTSSIAAALGDAPAAKPQDEAGVLRIADDTVLIGKSMAMQQVYRTMLGLMNNDVTAMVLGESGTGKELIARGLHLLGARKHKPFIALNMAAIPHELIESALFGHEKGAFTGAQNRQIGAFEQAEGGTLFLDEIGDMPLAAQTRLLRVLQEGSFTPVGSLRPKSCDVRIITATHRNLKQAVANGTFREDLFYRLHVVPITMPPLRARAEDIPPLCEHFMQEAIGRGLPHKTFDTSAMLALMHHDWPGNVRELKHIILRLCTTTPHPHITAADIQKVLAATIDAEMAPTANVDKEANETEPAIAFSPDALSAHEARIARELDILLPRLPKDVALMEVCLPLIERPLIMWALKSCGGSQVKAAKLLGINRNTLRTKIKQLALKIS